MPPIIPILAAFAAGYCTRWLIENRWFFRRQSAEARADITRAVARNAKSREPRRSRRSTKR